MLRAEDLERSVAWYEGKLGWSPVHRGADGDTPPYAVFDVADIIVTIWELRPDQHRPGTKVDFGPYPVLVYQGAAYQRGHRDGPFRREVLAPAATRSPITGATAAGNMPVISASSAWVRPPRRRVALMSSPYMAGQVVVRRCCSARESRSSMMWPSSKSLGV